MAWGWFALAALVGIVVTVRMVGGRAGSPEADVGSVSDQWVAEHRAGQSDDSI